MVFFVVFLFFFAHTEKTTKNTINLCGCEKQQSRVHMMHLPESPVNATSLQQQRGVWHSLIFVVRYWGKHTFWSLKCNNECPLRAVTALEGRNIRRKVCKGESGGWRKGLEGEREEGGGLKIREEGQSRGGEGSWCVLSKRVESISLSCLTPVSPSQHLWGRCVCVCVWWWADNRFSVRKDSIYSQSILFLSLCLSLTHRHAIK